MSSESIVKKITANKKLLSFGIGGVIAIAIIVGVIAGISGNKSESDSSNNDGGDNSSSVQEGEDGKTGEKDIIDYEIEEEDGKVVIKLSEDMIYVFYHNYEKVTDFEIYLGFEDHANANDMYKITKDSLTTEAAEELDYIDVKGRYVVYNYNEKGFYNDIETYEELIEFAKIYGIVLDAYNKKDAKDQIDWVTTEYSRPDDCILLGVKPDPNGLRVQVEWKDMDAAKAYKKLFQKETSDFGTVEEVEGYYAFQGTKVRISYAKNTTEENYILFYTEE